MGHAARSIAAPRHLAASISVVLVMGVGTYATAGEPGRLRAALAAALLGVVPAALWQVLLFRLERAIWPRLAALATRWSLTRFVTRDPSAPREPVVVFHAVVASVVFGLVALALGNKLLLLRLRAIQRVELRESLAVLGITGVALIALALAAFTRLGLRPALAALDRRWHLPLPPSAAGRTVLWLGLPVCLVALAALYALDATLGSLSAPLWILLVIGVQIVLRAVLPALSASELEFAWLALAPLLALWGADRVLATSPNATAELEEARPGSGLLVAARTLTDFDLDGASALFGGGDCAPFSRKRSPLARDIPGNGVDENCDGADDAPGTYPKPPTFYSGLRKQDIKHYDIVWVVIDTVRADHTSLLGYERPTTPILEELGRESVVFTNAFSQSSSTMLSIPSMLTGIDPGRITWVKESKRLQVEKQQRRYISDLLSSKGYQTGIVVTSYFRKRFPGLLFGYDWISYGGDDDRTAARTAAAQAVNFIASARRKPDPYLLVSYFSAPHSPYYPHSEGYPQFPSDEFTNYDLEIVSADRHIGFMLDMLRSDPERWNKTIVVVTADHGEEFNEHGATDHGRTCHAESLHVPLLLRIPGRAAQKVERPVGLVDIVPTLLELTGASASAPEGLDGSSLLFHTNAPERVQADRPLFCMIVNQKGAQGVYARRSVRSGKWKLMTELRSAKPWRLYDVEADPLETAPLEVSGARAQIASQLDTWLREQLTGNAHQIDLSME